MENLLLIIAREGMGSAPHELQTVLIINFFRTLLKENKTPGNIFFYADGVKLNQRGSVIEDYLVELETRGTKIVTCTTCLNFFGIVPDELVSGVKGGMNDLVALTEKSSKVISL